jgi:hypothetical protein
MNASSNHPKPSTPFLAVEPFTEEAWEALEESSRPHEPARRRNLVPFVAATLVLATTICVAAGIRFNQARSANATSKATERTVAPLTVATAATVAAVAQVTPESPKGAMGPSAPVVPPPAAVAAAATDTRAAPAPLSKRAPASRNDARPNGAAAPKAAARPSRAVPHTVIVGDAPF